MNGRPCWVLFRRVRIPSGLHTRRLHLGLRRRRRRRGRRLRRGRGCRRLFRRRRRGRGRVGRRSRRGRRPRVRPDGPTVAAAGAGVARWVLVGRRRRGRRRRRRSGSVVLVFSVSGSSPPASALSLSLSFSFSSTVVSVVEGVGAVVALGSGGTVVVVVGVGDWTNPEVAATAIAASTFGTASFCSLAGTLVRSVCNRRTEASALGLSCALTACLQLLDVLIRVVEGGRVDREADRVGHDPHRPGNGTRRRRAAADAETSTRPAATEPARQAPNRCGAAGAARRNATVGSTIPGAQGMPGESAPADRVSASADGAATPVGQRAATAAANGCPALPPSG